MLKLFITVALNPLKKRGEGQLLLMAQLGLLLLDHGLHLHAKKRTVVEDDFVRKPMSKASID